MSNAYAKIFFAPTNCKVGGNLRSHLHRIQKQPFPKKLLKKLAKNSVRVFLVNKGKGNKIIRREIVWNYAIRTMSFKFKARFRFSFSLCKRFTLL